ncbi:MAG: orotidine-5'-phosphate decarboxylase [Flavobacteriales bacterium]|nr:orotidine-5'-phosphate decarboxylase [Flavobacteriales bacterium]|tara:strand:+ start:12624 stop:13442 length:819 start_codon:yes stop_codon:yes gene_type:complete
MDIKSLISFIKTQKSFLCVGLDPDINQMPPHLLSSNDPIFEFNKSIIDASKNYSIAYKPNLAFYEKLGPSGLVSLKKTIDYIPKSHFIILDAKRSDVFNSAKMYAESFYNHYGCDAVTLSPYMGKDAIDPFIRKEKWMILLLTTSNPSAGEIQNIKSINDIPIYLEFLKVIKTWGSYENTMFVVGATKLNEMKIIRKEVPSHFFLVPGIGKQGGSLQKVCEFGLNSNCGLIINSSRDIIYASSNKNFVQYVSEKCINIQIEMENILKDNNII